MHAFTRAFRTSGVRLSDPVYGQQFSRTIDTVWVLSHFAYSLYIIYSLLIPYTSIIYTCIYVDMYSSNTLFLCLCLCTDSFFLCSSLSFFVDYLAERQRL